MPLTLSGSRKDLGHGTTLDRLTDPITGRPQTLGSVLNSLLPSLFPSPRNPLLAQPVLHGAVVPLSANAEELVRTAAYADGWMHICVLMLT